MNELTNNQKSGNYEEPDLVDYNILKSYSEVHDELTRSQFPDFFQGFRYLA